MRTTKLFLSGMLCLAGLTANAQTISLTSATPTSNTNDASTSVRIGTLAGNGSSSTGGANTFIGYQAGKVNTTGNDNSFFGKDAGKANTTGDFNLFLGSLSGNANIGGGNNVFTGYYAGYLNTSGNDNTFIGQKAGVQNSTGTGNVFVGSGAGFTNVQGNNNTYIGYNTGTEESSSGSGNIFIGSSAGWFLPDGTSNTLLIGNSETEQLIWGDFSTDQIKLNGKVGTGGLSAFPTSVGGVDVSGYSLFAKGGILTTEVRIATTGWADYVFTKDYQLPTLAEVEKHIIDKGHLINVPSAAEVEAQGIEVGQIAKIQQEKIEELTLYIIEQNKINEKQAQLIQQLAQRLEQLERK